MSITSGQDDEPEGADDDASGFVVYELNEWAPKLADAARDTRDLHVLMNNCYANYGATNARELARILADLKPAD